jgi:uncharacterized membrane protein HdeD (DUF308 family)
MDHLDHFIMGASAMASFIAGLFFMRFFRDTRDRLFLIFAMAFWLLGITRFLLTWTDADTETHTYLYTFRLTAFALILYAIVDKNRPASKADKSPG